MSTVVFAQYGDSSGGGGGSAVGTILYLILLVVVIAGMWRLFTKAGQPGWAAIIPIYNTITILRIAGRPWWWFLLMLIPIVNIVILIIVFNDLSKSFGYGVGFTIGLILLSPIFLCILGFGGARYLGPAGPEKSFTPSMA